MQKFQQAALITAAVILCHPLFAPLAYASEVVDDSFKSMSLARDYKMRVYLPDGYKDSAQSQYPVIYLLHGAGFDETWWASKGGAKETVDALTKRGQMRAAIVVMPGNGKNWFVDGAAEKAETAIISELIPYIESKYKASRERSMRMIGGFSMGGYGALNLSLKYPETFCAAMVMSPAIYDPLPPETSSARRAPQFARNGQFDAELWRSLNYPARIDAYQKGVSRVAYWIMSGDHDFLGIALFSAQLYSRLLSIQPKQVELRIVDGDHESLVWREALPDALRYADAQCAK